MSVYRKIVFATDLSASAERAKGLAVALARRSGAQLHVLHVNVLSALHMRYRGMAAAEEYARTLVEASKRTLDEIPDESGLDIQRAVRTDESPGNAILRYAGEEGVDLIAVGSEGHGAVKGVLLGSVATKVVHGAQIPVLVARHREEEAAGAPPVIRSIVAATDLSEHSRASVQHAAKLAAEHDARLTVLHVMVPVLANPYELERVIRDTDTQLGDKALASFLDKLALDVPAQRRIVVGPAHSQIVSAADELDADLLVIAAYGLSAVQRLLFGSVADKVVRTAPCPVLVHRATEAD